VRLVRSPGQSGRFSRSAGSCLHAALRRTARAMPVLRPYVTRDQVAERLPLIFPEGTPNRAYCIPELAASTIFAALYIGAVEGSGRYLGPVHVYRMTAEQASKSDNADREKYAEGILKKRYRVKEDAGMPIILASLFAMKPCVKDWWPQGRSSGGKICRPHL